MTKAARVHPGNEANDLLSRITHQGAEAGDVEAADVQGVICSFVSTGAVAVASWGEKEVDVADAPAVSIPSASPPTASKATALGRYTRPEAEAVVYDEDVDREGPPLPEVAESVGWILRGRGPMLATGPTLRAPTTANTAAIHQGGPRDPSRHECGAC
jgi:hypothetical protein